MKIEELEKLIALVDRSSLTSFTYESGGERICLSKCQTAVPMQPVAQMQQPSHAVSEAAAASQAQGIAVEKPATKEDGANKLAVKTPFVGCVTFHAGDADAPYVKVGDTVKAGQLLFTVEAMKIYNEIHAPKDGVVTDILVSEGDVVEFQQTILLLQE